ncbi:MAG: hypothetical protein AB7G62_12205 [Magnetospirillum sp.]
MQRSLEPDGDRDVGLWTAWLIRTLAREVRPDLGAVTYRPVGPTLRRDPPARPS